MSAARNELGVQTDDIKCDEPGCTVFAPDQATIMAGRGLVNMGWWCKGGRHYCPAHNPDNP